MALLTIAIACKLGACKLMQSALLAFADGRYAEEAAAAFEEMRS